MKGKSSLFRGDYSSIHSPSIHFHLFSSIPPLIWAQVLDSNATSTSSWGVGIGWGWSSQVSQELQSPLCVRGLLPGGHPRNTSPGRRQGGILTRCSNHFNCLRLIQRSSGSTSGLSGMSELRPPFLRWSPDTL